ncbi:MAG TPA: endonuclease III [Candidatus Methanomethylicus sp.]|nr:endonuclease III [Candidatus Methanomethylicus sp.]
MDGKSILAGMRAALGDGERTALEKISKDGGRGGSGGNGSSGNSNDMGRGRGSGRGSNDPFKVLIGTILSHRTRDERTEEATERLFKAYPTPAALASADRQEVARLIRGVGFYNVKSSRIIEVAKTIDGDLHGRVPETIEGLMELPAVGRKTANCVLVYGFGREAIPVDTHVHRISNRLGIARTATPDETEAALMRFFAREDWIDVNDLFVGFGKRVCRPIGPRCGECPLAAGCEYFKGIAKSGSKRKGRG